MPVMQVHRVPARKIISTVHSRPNIDGIHGWDFRPATGSFHSNLAYIWRTTRSVSTSHRPTNSCQASQKVINTPAYVYIKPEIARIKARKNYIKGKRSARNESAMHEIVRNESARLGRLAAETNIRGLGYHKYVV